MESSFSDIVRHLSFDLASCCVLKKKGKALCEGKHDAFRPQRDTLSLQMHLPCRVVDTHDLFSVANVRSSAEPAAVLTE